MANQILRIFGRAFSCRQLACIAAVFFLFFSANNVGAATLDPQAIFADFTKSLPTFSGPDIEFAKEGQDIYSKKIELFETNVVFTVFKLNDKASLAVTIEKISLGRILDKLEETPLDAFLLENVVIIYDPNRDSGLQSISADKFPDQVKTVLEKNGKEFFLRKGLNLIAKINTQNELDEVLKSLQEIGLPLDNLVLQSCFGKNSQHLITRKGTWNKPLGIDLPITDPTIAIRKEVETKNKVKKTTLFQMVWGKIQIEKEDYFLFAERSQSTEAKNNGIALALNGKTMSLKTIAALLNALPEKPLSVTGLDRLPLDSLTISNPKWKSMPNKNSFPDTKDFLLALSTSPAINLPNDQIKGPKLVINGTGEVLQHQLASLVLDVSKAGLHCNASLSNLKVGPISMGSARFDLELSAQVAKMNFSGETGFTVKDFDVAKQQLAIFIAPKNLSFKARATLANIGLGSLEGTSEKLQLDSANNFKLHFTLLDETVNLLLETGVDAYCAVKDKLLQAGVVFTEPDKLVKAIEFKDMFDKETWEDIGDQAKGIYTNTQKTVISIAAGTSAAIMGFESAAAATGKKAADLVEKIGDGIGYVANKLNPFKKKAKSKSKAKEEKKPRTPFEYEIVYNSDWVRDQAHRCETSSSAGSHAEGPVLRDLKNGDYLYSEMVKALSKPGFNKILAANVPPYPEKNNFISKKQPQPWWEVDLGKPVPVGAILIKAGGSLKFKRDFSPGALSLLRQTMKFLQAQKDELAKDGISDTILAVSATVKGNELMNPNNKNVKWFKISKSTELAIIRPMAGSSQHKQALDKAAGIRKTTDLMRKTKKLLELTKLNEQLVEATPKIRYLRLFKTGNAVLGIENFSVVHAKDATVKIFNQE